MTCAVTSLSLWHRHRLPGPACEPLKASPSSSVGGAATSCCTEAEIKSWWRGEGPRGRQGDTFDYPLVLAQENHCRVEKIHSAQPFFSWRTSCSLPPERSSRFYSASVHSGNSAICMLWLGPGVFCWLCSTSLPSVCSSLCLSANTRKDCAGPPVEAFMCPCGRSGIAP